MCKVYIVSFTLVFLCCIEACSPPCTDGQYCYTSKTTSKKKCENKKEKGEQCDKSYDSCIDDKCIIPSNRQKIGFCGGCIYHQAACLSNTFCEKQPDRTFRGEIPETSHRGTCLPKIRKGGNCTPGYDGSCEGNLVCVFNEKNQQDECQTPCTSNDNCPALKYCELTLGKCFRQKYHGDKCKPTPINLKQCHDMFKCVRNTCRFNSNLPVEVVLVPAICTFSS